MKLLSRLIGLSFVLVMLSMAVPQICSADQRPATMSLEDSVEEAVRNNWLLKARQEAVARAKHVEKQAKADFYPKFGTSYSYNRRNRVRTVPFGPAELPIGSRDNYSWNVTVTQPVFTGFALTAAHELSRLGVDTGLLEYEIEMLDVVLFVKEAYFAVLEADKGVEVARSAVESLESNVKVARDFYKVGIIPVNDVLRAEVELALARQNLVSALNGASMARSSFNTVLSRPIRTPVSLVDILVYYPADGDFEDFVDRALAQRPEMKRINTAIAGAEQEIVLARSTYYPEVSLTYRYLREGEEANVSGSPFHDSSSWDVTAGLTWTFWEWGRKRNSVAEKTRLREELLFNRQSIGDSVRLDVKSAVLSLDEAEKNIPTTHKAVEQAEENLRVNEERYRAQVSTITEVLDAQTLLTRARVDYYRSLYGHNVALARLLRAMGEQ